jgi:hypothetical protein
LKDTGGCEYVKSHSSRPSERWTVDRVLCTKSFSGNGTDIIIMIDYLDPAFHGAMIEALERVWTILKLF